MFHLSHRERVSKLRARRPVSLYALFGALVFALVTVSGVHVMGGPGALWDRWGIYSVLVLAPAHLAATVSPIGPFVPWGAANGALFGIVVGSLINWCVWVTTSLIQHAIGRRAQRDFDLDERMSRLPSWLQKFPIDHPIVLIAGRWVPVGAVTVNLSAGAAGVSRVRLFLCAMVGCIPQALFVTSLGRGVFVFW